MQPPSPVPGGTAHAVAGDISTAEGARALVAGVEAEIGPIAILVNNAGITRDNLIMKLDDDDWRAVIDTNLGGAFFTCRAVARPMLKRRAGAIVNMSSVVGVHGNAGQTNYAASKAGLIGLTKSLAKELGSRGIRVNAVAPGYISTAAHRCAAAGRSRCDPAADAARPARRSCGRRPDGAVPGVGRGGICDRRRTGGGRRVGDMNANGRRRVVITGMGAVTPNGLNMDGHLGGDPRRPVGRVHASRASRCRRAP